MRIINSDVHFTKDVLSISEVCGSTDIDDLIKDWNPQHTVDEILITLKFKDKDPFVYMWDIIQTTPPKNRKPRKPHLKYQGKYYTFEDIHKYTDTAYSGYTVDVPVYNRRKCLNSDRWFGLDHSIMDSFQESII